MVPIQRSQKAKIPQSVLQIQRTNIRRLSKEKMTWTKIPCSSTLSSNYCGQTGIILTTLCPTNPFELRTMRVCSACCSEIIWTLRLVLRTFDPSTSWRQSLLEHVRKSQESRWTEINRNNKHQQRSTFPSPENLSRSFTVSWPCPAVKQFLHIVPLALRNLNREPQRGCFNWNWTSQSQSLTVAIGNILPVSVCILLDPGPLP